MVNIEIRELVNMKTKSWKKKQEWKLKTENEKQKHHGNWENERKV